jgi:CBS domain containing-hemolysin-like protein
MRVSFLGTFMLVMKGASRSVVMSRHLSAYISSVSSGWILVNLGFGGFYENLFRKLIFGLNQTKILALLHEDLTTFMLLAAVQNIL